MMADAAEIKIVDDEWIPTEEELSKGDHWR
jgi:hypothetical protein